MKTTLKVEGMHCKSCEIVLKESLEEISGITDVSVSYAKGTVIFSATDDALIVAAKQVIVKEGYKVK
ncbi:MAG: heavy metal-associated domain-containing protein [Nanoarchaeota archaeon]|nr:heavy metal-associated domain-containing protein [Nanoarchaeota archaeon]